MKVWNWKLYVIYFSGTGKSFSEALILASTNPQYDKRLFIELRVQYMKTTSSEHVVYINCSELSIQKQNLLSYCGLVDARISDSEKDLLTCTQKNGE